MLLFVPTAFALPLLSEHFDANAMPAGWKTTVVVGPSGPPSTVAFQDGGVVLTTTAKNRRFTGAQKKIELRDVAWVKITARVKATGVAPGSWAPICGLYARFEGGELLSGGGCPTNSEWTEVQRVLAVPEGAHDVDVGFVLPVAGTVVFDDLLVEPLDAPWKKVGRGTLTYHWLSSDPLPESTLSANDEAYEAVQAFLGLTTPPHVEWWKYPDLATKQQYTAQPDPGSVEGDAVHTIFRSDPRELVTVMARSWGDPPPLLTEGLWLAYTGELEERDVKTAARQLANGSGLPTLATLLDPVKFAAEPNARITAGAFSKWVIEAKGRETLQKAWGATHRGATAAENQKALETALGMSLADAEKALKAWL